MNLLDLALVVMTLSLIPCLYRIAFGPTIADRVVGLDALTLVIVVILGAYSYVQESSFFLDAALVMAIIGFIGTIAIARYLEEGEIF
ncbi:MAG: multicomponent Na+:H+ antiporter subunit [Methanolobus sp.]|jgi:multisubunit Na+/H+ antiporter MnhF subunit|nr:multicomponent Na+:H+ antiporter subunit [Methanolobus sp.]MDK2833920.1 multicomponent Na+:H+ antiporter subunit [Methanolobus sp.]MDK2911926.1 multicomponent Na+:H+ antiporter subunit [Methanolobus sp.]MDN5310756.1 multicomponent Na+:H+ antiporter subunit [Methanolobus sp.]